jgi:hypothetical protein
LFNLSGDAGVSVKTCAPSESFTFVVFRRAPSQEAPDTYTFDNATQMLRNLRRCNRGDEQGDKGTRDNQQSLYLSVSMPVPRDLAGSREISHALLRKFAAT